MKFICCDDDILGVVKKSIQNNEDEATDDSK